MKTIPLIISHEHKYIYYWVPKVASSTVRRLLASHECIKWIPQEQGDTKFIEISREEIHKYPDYFKFAFVRNPYSRMLSCYMDKIINTRTIKDAWGIKDGEILRFKKDHNICFKNMTFNDFIHFLASTNDEISNGHFRSVHSFLDLDVLDFMGRVENFDNDIEKIKRKLSIKQEHEHLRKTKHGYYKDYYDKDLREIMEKRYKRDFELFNYGF